MSPGCPPKQEEEEGLTARGLGDAVGAALADSEAMVRRAAADVPHPDPYTLHPTPYTLHPSPYTLNPEP